MPIITVDVIEDVFSSEQKKEIIEKMTDTMVSIEGENLRHLTFCIVNEVKGGDWGIGGKALTAEDVKAVASGK